MGHKKDKDGMLKNWKALSQMIVVMKQLLASARNQQQMFSPSGGED